MEKPGLLTDAELRAVWPIRREKTYHVPRGTIITPAARDYLRENGIELVYDRDTMTVTSIPMRDGKPEFRSGETGQALSEKPEDMTHLRGNLLVSKTHPRIGFRGKLDSLMARVLLIQVTAEGECPGICDALEEVLMLLRRLMAAEVKEQPLESFTLLGLSDGQIRSATHNLKRELGIDHPTPSHTMGRLCMELNLLRTQVREAELCAVRTFTENGACTRLDIVQALNRTSSCIYLLMCRKLAGYYDKRR